MTLLHRLSNGLTLLLEPQDDAQTVAAGYFVATGARDERPEEMGASHFLEHLMFKGSEEVGARELNVRLDELGGHANAFTSEEATVYHAAALPEDTSELLGTLTELMRPALRPEEIDTERGVILEEIAMYAEQPAVRVTDGLRAAYWGAHPLGHSVLGTSDTVRGLTRDVLVRNHRERYGADAVTLAVVGAFDAGSVQAWAEDALRGWPARTASVPARDTPPPAAPGTLCLMGDERLTRAQVALAVPGLPAAHPLREAAVVLSELIGGENGLLYWALLDTGLADSADLAHLDYRDVGSFEGGFSCDPGRTQEVLDAYRRVLADAPGAITETAVRRAARKLAVGTLLRSETPQGRLFALGMEHLALGQALSTGELVERSARVTLADVRAVLNLCPFESPTVVALGPVSELH
ncbi:M16 family metallopeptidase [Deinococcus hopiensis]|uniref:Predicted Zn-dependent peptidase n=1 Tax=Deinococcus hopiensis KR-140 TaxID=695939 RepID=A0A1W1VTG1_9DEIO|nr:pitrilysin family protein [Deinococcus hopiensis]SMB96174.1 Predicted Zn-dependent peptidase [Deinococcus hopiensis KR-140]